MKGYKYLAKNIALMTIGNFASRMLSFFLVPLYTSILTTKEYGIFDLMIVSVQIMVPILTQNIMESVLRFSMDENQDKDFIVSYAVRLFCISCLIVVVLVGVNHFTGILSFVQQYSMFFFFIYSVTAIQGIIMSYARGIGKVADVSISGVISSIALVSLNILLLVVYKNGIIGYFISYIVALGAQSAYLFLKTGMWKNIHLLRKEQIRSVQAVELMKYSRPMILNSIAWWVNNVSDRYVVVWMCGLAANGIYSVAGKIPSILNIFQTIFSQAWVISAVKEFDPEDKHGFFSNLYNTYNFLMVFLCSLLIVFDRQLAAFLYAKDFYLAWRYVPFLMIAIVFGSMSGFIGGVFSAVKNSKIFAQSTLMGAFSNIVLNFILIYLLKDPMGAAIATAFTYWIVWVIRVRQMKKYMRIKLFLLRDYLSYGLLVIQTILVLNILHDDILFYGFTIVISLIILYLYRREFENVLNKFGFILKTNLIHERRE